MSDSTRRLPPPDFPPPPTGAKVVAVVAFSPPVLDVIAEADHRLATTQQLRGIVASGNRHDVRGHPCDPDTTPATSCILASKVRSLQHFQAIQWIT